ncbi:MAG: rod shape-determining protein MreD [Bacteroidia bacterium]|nr:rod shape-determining protein MreD [Bacteroidia bacterium]
MNQILRQVLSGLLLILLQVFLANQMVLYDLATPYIFLLFLLFFPLEYPKPVQYLTGFMVGLMVDWLSLQGPIGLHAFCGTFLMWVREPLLGVIGSSSSAHRGTGEIKLNDQQGVWYLTYFLPLILIYLALHVFLEAMSFAPFWLLFGKLLASSLYTLVVCLVLTFIFYRR